MLKNIKKKYSFDKETRLAQNQQIDFKHIKFTPDLTDYCSMGQKHCRSEKKLKIGQRLDMPICCQSFTV